MSKINNSTSLKSYHESSLDRKFKNKRAFVIVPYLIIRLKMHEIMQNRCKNAVLCINEDKFHPTGVVHLFTRFLRVQVQQNV